MEKSIKKCKIGEIELDMLMLLKKCVNEMGISLPRCDNQMDYAWGLASDDFKVKLDEVLMSLK